MNTPPRRLLTVGHSYAVALNRRLAHEMGVHGAGRWEVTAVAPSFVYGNLRPIPLERTGGQECALEEVPLYLSQWTHVMRYGARLRQLLQAHWDAVHCWQEPFVFAGAQVAAWTPRRTSLVYYTHQNIDKWYPWPFSRFERQRMERADGWVGGGQTVRTTLLGRGYGEKPHRVIPLGVDVRHFRPDPDSARGVLRELEWQPGPPTVGFLGRFIKAKGVELLMSVLEDLTVPWRALFVGGGPMEGALRKWGAPFGERVRVVTNVPHHDVPRYLNAMDVLCAPSRTTARWREQFGRMIIEAFACGVTVLASDSGEIPYVVGDAGVVVRESDRAAWAASLHELLSDRPLRVRLGLAGRQRAHDVFSWPVVAQQTLDFVDQLTP